MALTSDAMCTEVSVVVPVFNGSATLRRSLESVLNQSLQAFEILVVDDGSTDGSLEIATQIGDSRIRCLRHDRNRGAATARNTGITAARGQYVAFIDADDEWDSEKLAKQRTYLSGAGRRVVAVCSGFVMQRFDRASGHERIPDAPRGWSRELLDVCPLAPGATLMVERRVFEEVGLFYTELERFEDWDWLLRYVRRYDLAVVPESLATVYSRPYSCIAAVDRSASTLSRRQRAAVKKAAGYFGERTFRASLWLERAIVRWRAGCRGSAILCVGYAIFLSPARALRMVARIGRKLASADL